MAMLFKIWIPIRVFYLEGKLRNSRKKCQLKRRFFHRRLERLNSNTLNAKRFSLDTFLYSRPAGVDAGDCILLHCVLLLSDLIIRKSCVRFIVFRCFLRLMFTVLRLNMV